MTQSERAYGASTAAQRSASEQRVRDFIGQAALPLSLPQHQQGVIASPIKLLLPLLLPLPHKLHRRPCYHFLLFLSLRRMQILVAKKRKE